MCLQGTSNVLSVTSVFMQAFEHCKEGEEDATWYKLIKPEVYN